MGFPKENDRLCKVAKDYNRIYKHYACDLTKLHEVEKTIDQMLDEIFENEPPTLYLINNAAIVQPVNQAMNIDESELISHMHINTIAPMIMTNKCLKKVHDSNTYFIAVQLTSRCSRELRFMAGVRIVHPKPVFRCIRKLLHWSRKNWTQGIRSLHLILELWIQKCKK